MKLVLNRGLGISRGLVDYRPRSLVGSVWIGVVLFTIAPLVWDKSIDSAAINAAIILLAGFYCHSVAGAFLKIALKFTIIIMVCATLLARACNWSLLDEYSIRSNSLVNKVFFGLLFLEVLIGFITWFLSDVSMFVNP